MVAWWLARPKSIDTTRYPCRPWVKKAHENQGGYITLAVLRSARRTWTHKLCQLGDHNTESNRRGCRTLGISTYLYTTQGIMAKPVPKVRANHSSYMTLVLLVVPKMRRNPTVGAWHPEV